MRGSWVLMVAVLLLADGCARRETEDQMRERVRREERQRRQRQAGEREESRQAERRRAEELRQERERQRESLHLPPAHGPRDGVMSALAPRVMDAQKDHANTKRDGLPQEMRPRAGASMGARPRAPSRYRAPAPVPRRRLKRPRRRRSPSLEGLFE